MTLLQRKSVDILCAAVARWIFEAVKDGGEKHMDGMIRRDVMGENMLLAREVREG